MVRFEVLATDDVSDDDGEMVTLSFGTLPDRGTRVDLPRW